MMDYNVVYVGNEVSMINAILENKSLKLCGVVYVTGRVCDHYTETLIQYGISSIDINDKPDYSAISDFCERYKIDAILMYKFEFILPESFVKRFRIVNFHGGSLYDNRGGNATVWTILNREEKTCLSMYELTGGIDEGKLISEYSVGADIDNETPVSLNKKLQTGIPSLLMLFCEYMDGKINAQLVLGGKYIRKVRPADYTIDAINDGFDVIKAKVRSQVGYNGAIIIYGNKQYKIFKYFEDKKSFAESRRVILEGDFLIIMDNCGELRLCLQES